MGSDVALILLAALVILLAGLFSGSETGLYQLSSLRLRLGTERRHIRYYFLNKAISDKNALIISLLLATNLSHYLATSLVTLVLLRNFSNVHIAEVFATAILTPVLFVFSELIPKNLFFYRADFLMPWVAAVLFFVHKILKLSGIVGVFKLAVDGLSRLFGSLAVNSKTVAGVNPNILRLIGSEIHEEGFLSPVQTEIIKRLPDISHITIRSIMRPVSKVEFLSINSDRDILLKKLSESDFTRFVVWRSRPANIVGYINIYECLSGGENFSDLKEFVKPIREIDVDMTVAGAMEIMQKERHKIMLAVRPTHRGHHRPLGIVTTWDLLEELIGELHGY